MTGFGSSVCAIDDCTYTIDIKSINSKTLDLVQKLPSALKNKENSIRTIIAQYLDRGKIDVTITAEAANGSDSTSIDEPTFHKHYNEIKALADKTNATLSDAVVDGNLVTAAAWPAHPALMAAFAKLLGAKISI